MKFRKFGANTGRRVAAATVVAGLVAAAVAGCAPGGSSENAGSATSGKIDWWGWTPDVTVGERYIEEFNKVYPDIEVTYKNFENGAYNAALRPALSSSVGPDVFDMALGGNVGEFPTFGDFALDLKPAVEKELGADWQDKYSFSHDGLTRKDGSLAGVSLGGVAAGFLWVNQSLFDEFKLTVPTTYDEWVNVCATFKANGVGCLAMGAGGANQLAVETLRSVSDSIEPGFYNDAIVGKRDWSEDTFVEALTIVKKMQSDGIIPADAVGLEQYPDANNSFMSEKSAMVQMGSWYAQYSRAEGAKIAMEGAGVANPEPFLQLPASFPDVAGKGNKPGYFGEMDYGLAVNARSDNTAAATTFALWLTSTTKGASVVANAIDLVPSLKGVEPDWTAVGLAYPDVQEPALKEMFAKASSVSEPRSQFITPPLFEALGVALVSVLEGTTTPDEAAQTLQASAVKAAK